MQKCGLKLKQKKKSKLRKDKLAQKINKFSFNFYN